MTKRFVPQTLLLTTLSLVASSTAFAQGGCTQDALGRVICAPPGGGAQTDSLGRVLCGPGQCVVDALGRVYCSSQPSGGAAVDALGRPVCVGGCVPGSSSYCQTLR
jgi:hypothetical protein